MDRLPLHRSWFLEHSRVHLTTSSEGSQHRCKCTHRIVHLTHLMCSDKSIVRFRCGSQLSVKLMHHVRFATQCETHASRVISRFHHLRSGSIQVCRQLKAAAMFRISSTLQMLRVTWLNQSTSAWVCHSCTRDESAAATRERHCTHLFYGGKANA